MHDIMTSLKANHLFFSYGERPLIHDVSLSLQPGDFTILLGPNGSGKSTVLKLLSGRLRPQSGAVTWDDRPLHDLSGRQRAAHIAVVPQAAPPAIAFSARERVAIARRAVLSPFQELSPEDDDAISQAMELFDVLRFAKHACHELSGGELQRVLLAAAVAQHADVMLLDEPTASLDPAHAIQAIQTLRELPWHPAIFMITHDIQLAQFTAKWLLLLQNGTVIREGAPLDVLSPDTLSDLFNCPTAIRPSLSFY